ncbi:hypothetical protein NFIA_035120 [Paecilomyces variotii No. 5]|uniref:Uncharacterized protein n=1 Tax=Byssochlamys spectabilis (strain No. 5 / NBRC 109023) TaxID=1356009 RepID=V5GFM9_BYSSN|nr:hypothetical protein NFIA_035120 [Paecilomyces variotii No. 5]
MLIPFVGIFALVALWGTFLPVPLLSDPSEGFVKRLTGAIHATTLSKGVYDLAELVSAYVPPGYGEAYFGGVVYDGSKEQIVTPTDVETGLSLVIRLRNDETGASSRGNTSSDEPPVSDSSFDLSAYGYLVFCVGLAAVVWARWTGLMSLGVPKLEEAIDNLESLLDSWSSPKVAHYLVADGVPSAVDVVVALVEGNEALMSELSAGYQAGTSTSSVSAVPPTKQEALDVWIHRKVVEAISRLERRRVLATFPELESCTTAGSTAVTDGAVEPFTKKSLDASNVSEDDSCFRLPRQWALVVRCPENLAPVMVFQFVCALAANWERYLASSDQQAVSEVVQGAEDASAPASRRKRPSQQKRKRQARRALKDKQEELITEIERSAVVMPASPAPVAPLASTPNLGPAMAPPASPYYGPGYGRQGPRPTPNPYYAAYGGPQTGPYGPASAGAYGPAQGQPQYGPYYGYSAPYNWQYGPYMPPNGPYRRY